MKHYVFPLFAIPVVQMKINIDGIVDFYENRIKNKTDHLLYNKLEKSNNKKLRHYYNDSSVLHLFDELKDIHDQIIEASNFVYKDVMNHSSGLVITNSWFNECDIGGTQPSHIHANSVLSGTLYLRTDEHTHLSFYRGAVAENTNALEDDSMLGDSVAGYSFHCNTMSFRPNDGDCLFWPSFMKHGYENNQTPNRLSLSFNMMPTSLDHLYKFNHFVS